MVCYKFYIFLQFLNAVVFFCLCRICQYKLFIVSFVSSKLSRKHFSIKFVSHLFCKKWCTYEYYMQLYLTHTHFKFMFKFIAILGKNKKYRLQYTVCQRTYNLRNNFYYPHSNPHICKYIHTHTSFVKSAKLVSSFVVQKSKIIFMFVLLFDLQEINSILLAPIFIGRLGGCIVLIMKKSQIQRSNAQQCMQ